MFMLKRLAHSPRAQKVGQLNQRYTLIAILVKLTVQSYGMPIKQKLKYLESSLLK